MSKTVLSSNDRKFILEALNVIPSETEDDSLGDKKNDSDDEMENVKQKSKSSKKQIKEKRTNVTTEAIRIDGRQPYDFRDVIIRFQEERLGQVQVSVGKTRVMAVVSYDITEPFPERPTEGFLIFNTELSPMAGLHYARQRSIQSEASIEISRVVERALRGSRAIDTEALCIVSGEKVWSLRVDMHVLDDHGNVLDCAHLAAISALLHFRRPEVTVGEGGKVVIHTVQDREPVPLSIHHIPVCVSFAFFEDGTVCCVDPSLKEEEIMGGMMTVAVNTHEQVCAVQKGGGVPLHVHQILQCTKIAALKAKDLTALIETALRNDEKQRKLNKLPIYARPKETGANKQEQVVSNEELLDLNDISDDEDGDDDMKDDVIFMKQSKKQFESDLKDFKTRK
jgi:exosome complex component RRP45